MEIWKPIINYETKYMVSNEGRIKSNYTNLILKPIMMNTGYYRVSLCKNKIKKSFYIHRLVAQHFIPNENNYNEINHINGIKSDNKVDNLEWCDRKYNVRHSFDYLNHNRRGIKVKCVEKNLCFNSLKEASDYFNGKSSNLSMVLNHRNRCKTFCGYHWKYC